MWICENCGKIMDELDSWEEDRGESFGFPAYEKMWGCDCDCPDVHWLGDGKESDDWDLL